MTGHTPLWYRHQPAAGFGAAAGTVAIDRLREVQMRTWRAAAVPTDGGQLQVGVADGAGGGTSPALLAVHGITASQLAWRPVARQLPEYRFIAPDLRGRGRSADLPGPYGLARHADDLARCLDALGVDRATVVGHSMGGFVALVFGHRHADRVHRLLLVDGGVPLPVPAGVSTPQLIEAILGPALARLEMTFPDREAYRRFWQTHPAFAECWNADIEAYVDYDLVGTEPKLRSCVRRSAVHEDSVDQVDGTALREAVAAVGTAELRMLRAPLGLQGQPPGLYPEPWLTACAAERLPGLRWRTVPEVNHYTILLGQAGARAVADDLRQSA